MAIAPAFDPQVLTFAILVFIFGISVFGVAATLAYRRRRQERTLANAQEIDPENGEMLRKLHTIQKMADLQSSCTEGPQYRGGVNSVPTTQRRPPTSSLSFIPMPGEGTEANAKAQVSEHDTLQHSFSFMVPDIVIHSAWDDEGVPTVDLGSNASLTCISAPLESAVPATLLNPPKLTSPAGSPSVLPRRLIPSADYLDVPVPSWALSVSPEAEPSILSDITEHKPAPAGDIHGDRDDSSEPVIFPSESACACRTETPAACTAPPLRLKGATSTASSLGDLGVVAESESDSDYTSGEDSDVSCSSTDEDAECSTPQHGSGRLSTFLSDEQEDALSVVYDSYFVGNEDAREWFPLKSGICDADDASRITHHLLIAQS